MTDEGYPRHRWKALGVLCLSLVIVVVDDTVLNVAVPAVVRQLHTTQSQLQWAVDAYIIVFGGLLFAAGSLSDRYGRKRLLDLGLIIFGLSSWAAAYAPTAPDLIVARAVQGLGAALIMPSTLSILVHIFPPREISGALGLWSGASGIGIVLGPLLAGVLLQKFWWGSVFLINLPVVVAALLLGMLYVPESRLETGGSRPDWAGTLLSILGFSSLLYAIIEAPGASPGRTLAACLVALVALLGFGWWELTTPAPMVELRLFRQPALYVPSLIIGGTFLIFVGTAFAMTQYLQFVLDCSPLVTGMVMAPLSVSWSLVAPFTPRWCRGWGDRAVITAGLVLVALAMGALACLGAHSHPAWGVVCMLALGAGMGSVSTPVTRLIMSAVPNEYSGMASSTNHGTRQLGAALGVAALGSTLAEVYRGTLAPQLETLPAHHRQVVLDNVGSALKLAQDWDFAALADSARTAFLQGFHTTNLSSAVVALILAYLAYHFLPRGFAQPAQKGEGPAAL